MKKTLFLLYSLFIVANAVAQKSNDSDIGFMAGFEMRGSALSSKNDMNFKNAELEVMIGYDISHRFSFYLPVTQTVGLFNEDNIKNYETATQLGLGAGYSPINDKRIQLEIAGKLGTTLGGSWQYMYYDLGVRLGLPRRIYVGVGVRYYDCYGGQFPNYCTLYGLLGCRLNFHKHK